MYVRQRRGLSLGLYTRERDARRCPRAYTLRIIYWHWIYLKLCYTYTHSGAPTPSPPLNSRSLSLSYTLFSPARIYTSTLCVCVRIYTLVCVCVCCFRQVRTGRYNSRIRLLCSPSLSRSLCCACFFSTLYIKYTRLIHVYTLSEVNFNRPHGAIYFFLYITYYIVYKIIYMRFIYVNK